MDRPKVCAVEWDGQYLSASIEYVIITYDILQHGATGQPALKELMVTELQPGGQFRVHRRVPEEFLEQAAVAHRHVLALLADLSEAIKGWPATRLYYDASVEHFDYSSALDMLQAHIAAQLNMNRRSHP